MDVLQQSGFCLLLNTALGLAPGGVLWAAPPCSTWVWLSRQSTGRHLQPEGNRLSRQVVGQNALVERLVLVLEILTLRGVFWIIEQPTNSVMWDYPAMQACLQRHGIRQGVQLDMGAYGGTSLKPTTLMGTAPYLWVLERRCPRGLRERLSLEGVVTTTTWTDESGQKRAQGTAELKGTQAYPEGFGAAHALAFAGHFGQPSATPGLTEETPGAASSSAAAHGLTAEPARAYSTNKRA